MEDFAAKEQKGIKEKNLYMLNLDTPRIIILSSVIIGLIIISVLIGMNINKHDQKDGDGFIRDNTVLENLAVDNSEKSNPHENNNIESPLNNENIIKNQDNFNQNIIADNSIKPKGNIAGTEDNSQKALNNPVRESLNNNTSDILTHENIETIIPPANTAKKAESKKIIKKSHEKHSDNPQEKKRRRGVVEVSSKEKPDKLPADKSYFSIQVASFDKKSKAMAEINKLESQKYSAYLDSANIKNKTFYRVMVGPIYSKKKAADLLDEISSNNRYEESYIIKR